MRARDRRALGLIATGIYMTVYIFFAASVGGLFAEKPWYAQIAFFAVAGIVWVFPLRPLFLWMSKPDADELPPEKPPATSVVKRR
jgi:membrane protein implicated in regulation of membrane protease activity